MVVYRLGIAVFFKVMIVIFMLIADTNIINFSSNIL